MKFGLLLLVFSIGFISESNSQNDYSKDLSSIDNVIEALYDVISGDKGVKRDWDRMRNLFVENARLAPTRINQEGVKDLRMMTVEDYITTSGAWLEENGFFEKEIHRVTEQYGSLVHLWSTYESYRTSEDDEPFARGINSIQLLEDEEGWKVVQIYWLSETPDNPIPAKYLPKS